MKALSILDEVVRELEQDVNVTRIKRILFFSCKEFWENDPNSLANADLGSLIEELCAKYSRLEDIEAVLNNIVSKVNKKTEYALVADQIICQLSRLYEYQDFTKLETNISHFDSQEAPSFEEHFSSELPAAESNGRDPGNLFDVRQKIVQQTNPLRAKILIFSTLYHQFTFSERDWLLLKTQELDRLLRQLFNLFPTVGELEAQLYRIASNLDNTDESERAASAIVKALSPCYEKMQQEERDCSEDSATEDCDQTRLSNGVYEDSKPIKAQRDYFEAGDITSIIQSSPAHYHYDPQKSYLVPSPVENLPFQTPQTATQSASGGFKQQAIANSTVAESPSAIDNREPTVLTKNISDSIKEKLELEEEIKRLVANSASSATNEIEKIFSELEANINAEFAQNKLEERLDWKYQSLINYAEKIHGFTGKLIKLLKELEAKESSQTASKTLADVAENVSETSQTKSREKANQHQLVEMAKQGNPKAIAMLLDRLLQPRGITATAGFKDTWLHVILESNPAPDQENLALYVHKKLCTLKSKSWERVKIHGRLSGNKTVAWSQEFVNKIN